MDLYTQFKTDTDLVKDGFWLEYYGDDDKEKPARFLVSFFNEQNAAFQKSREAKTRRYRRQMANDTMPPAAMRRITMEIFVEACLHDWEDVDGPDGPMKFTRENALQLFTDLPSLYEDVVGQSSMFTNFRETSTEEDSGNSPKSSGSA